MKAINRLFVLLLLICTTAAYGQIVKVGEGSFSTATVLNFGGQERGVTEDQAEAGDLFSAWGVRFVGSDSGFPTIVPSIRKTDVSVSPTQPPLFAFSLINQRAGSSAWASSSRPLVIDLKMPARQVGLRLVGMVAGSISANIKALDSFGNLLGTSDQAASSEPQSRRTTFVGIETSAPQGISKIVIDYGTATRPEEVEELLVNYLTVPKFSTYLAQIADGFQSGGTTVRTTIIVENSTNLAAQVRLSLFDSGGNPLSVQINGTAASSRDFSLSQWSSASFTTGGAGTLQAGYARVESTVPVDSTASFQVLDLNGNLLTEAGVGAAPGRPSAVAAIQKSLNGDFDTGIAVVNTSAAETTVRLRLFDETSQLIGMQGINLGPGQHRAKFFAELFPQYISRDVQATLLVTSSEPLSLVTLRLWRGLPLSSLPVGSTQLPSTLGK